MPPSAYTGRGEGARKRVEVGYARRPAITLRRLQRQLERLYEIDIDHDVEDFLITDAELARRIDNAPAARATTEKLLVRQAGDGLDLALYLDAGVVQRLQADDPTDHLHDDNLADLWLALEGVSHFVYLLWNARHARSVTLLELELQAEVDKYVTTALLCARQRAGRVPRELHRRLFEDVRFDSALDELGLERYRSANVYASMYCTALRDLYLRRPGREGMIPELRRFYRLGQSAKINRIHVHRHARRVS